MSESYDMIDKFLRNNLGDEEYSLYSEALDDIFSGKVDGGASCDTLLQKQGGSDVPAA